jgi:cytochrome P450
MVAGECARALLGTRKANPQSHSDTRDMFLGHESSTNTLLWALHSLSIHPDVQGRLREEITANLPDSGPPTTSAIDSLEYLDRFVKEVFRLYPARKSRLFKVWRFSADCFQLFGCPAKPTST